MLPVIILRIMDSNWISSVSALLRFESRLLCGPVKADLEQASWPSLEKVFPISLMKTISMLTITPRQFGSDSTSKLSLGNDPCAQSCFWGALFIIPHRLPPSVILSTYPGSCQRLKHSSGPQDPNGLKPLQELGSLGFNLETVEKIYITWRTPCIGEINLLPIRSHVCGCLRMRRSPDRR